MKTGFMVGCAALLCLSLTSCDSLKNPASLKKDGVFSRTGAAGKAGDGLRPASSIPIRALALEGAPGLTAPLNGTFFGTITSGEMTSAQIPDYFDELQSLKMNTLVIVAVQTKTGYYARSDEDDLDGDGIKEKGNCANPTYDWFPRFPDMLGPILREAENRGMSVYVGLVFTKYPAACTAKGPGDGYLYNPNKSLTAQATATTVANILKTYGSSRALKGWYIPDEPPIGYWTDQQEPDFISYYAEIAKAIRSQDPALPILISPALPNFADDAWITPQKYVERVVRFKKATGIDLFAIQDTIGSRHAGSPVNLAQRPSEIGINYYFTELSKAIGRSALWANHEIFPALTGYYGSAPLDRVRRQIDLVPDSLISKRIVFTQQHLMSTVSPLAHKEGARLLAAYRAHYLGQGRMITPLSVTWITPPDSQYPDNALRTKLIDGKIGDPVSHARQEWVGIIGKASMDFDFGQVTPVDWVGAHVLFYYPGSILFPSRMVIQYSNDKRTWNTAQSLPFPRVMPTPTSTSLEERDRNGREYVFSNPTPLGVSSRYLRITLENTRWTFLSEVEFVGPSSPGITYPKPLYTPMAPLLSLQVPVTWDRAADSRYPDSTPSKVADGRIGAAGDLQSGSWVGNLKLMALTQDLRSIRRLDQVSLWLMQYAPGAVKLPTTARIQCSIDNRIWAEISNYYNPSPAAQDGVYRMSLQGWEDIYCRYVKIMLSGPDWIFLSEASVYGISISGEAASAAPLVRPRIGASVERVN